MVKAGADDMVVQAIERELAFRQLEFYTPYPKQREFHRVGGDEDVRERLLIAGNQVGKTLCAASEVAMHLTGIYPDWWDGIYFEEPVSSWAASTTSQTTRDNVQRLLLGEVGSWGSGAIPKAKILPDGIKRAAHGVSDAVETILVRHVTGGISRVTLKSYDQGRLRWQGETLGFVWYDEEPPLDIYLEGLTRTNATGGITFTTLTPLLGMSAMVRRFLIDKPPGTTVVRMDIEDALHYTPAQRAVIISSYPDHERDARTKGVPVLGSGLIFPIPEDQIQERPVSLPTHWPRIVGLDIGYDHPTAAVWMAWDRDTDVVHIYDCYRVRHATPVIHAAAIKARGSWIPVAWPHDALQHDKGQSCTQIAKQYHDLGVNMLPEKATHPPLPNKPGKPDGGFGREAGLMDMLDRMQTGRLRVAKHLHDWWEEFRLNHRKDGKVVTVGDDLMSATRMGVMMLRKAQVAVKPPRPNVPAWRPAVSGIGVLG